MSSLLLVFLLPLSVLAGDWTVGVRGQLMCGDKPLSGADVRMWELDTWPDPDDLLSQVTTDSNGRFEIKGTENEITQISVALKLYHRCNNNGKFTGLPNLCKRKQSYEVPSKYITRGTSPTTWYDFGTVNVEAKQKGEDTDCLPSIKSIFGRK